MSRAGLVCFFTFMLSNTEAASILGVFPIPSLSHQIVFRSLTHELNRRGHKTVVITTDPAYPKDKAPENLTEIDVGSLSYKLYSENNPITNFGDIKFLRKQLGNMSKGLLMLFEHQLNETDVKNLVKSKNKFDLMLVESWVRLALGYSHVFKAPIIAMSSFSAVFDEYYIMGAPLHPTLYPGAWSVRFFSLSLWNKLKVLYGVNLMLSLAREAIINENKALKRFFDDKIPSLSEMRNNIDMFFVNSFLLWGGCLPYPLSVVHLGALHMNPEKYLPQDLQEYLDSSVHGVIYLSFGTNIDMSVLPAVKIQAFINVFSQLPYDVLWRWNQDELPGRTENIKILKWLPQSDLLRHPKIKLFITQAGQQSTDEAILSGVPMIGIPMLGDQFNNALRYDDHKIGKKIFLDELDEEVLMRTIKTVIDDNSYKNNVFRLRTLFMDQPMTSLERAVWWTEYVVKHGGRHLRAPAANMGVVEYYELHLVLIVVTIAAAVIGALFWLWRKIVMMTLTRLKRKFGRKTRNMLSLKNK